MGSRTVVTSAEFRSEVTSNLPPAFLEYDST